jgi:hypothetical protein
VLLKRHKSSEQRDFLSDRYIYPSKDWERATQSEGDLKISHGSKETIKCHKIAEGYM